MNVPIIYSLRDMVHFPNSLNTSKEVSDHWNMEVFENSENKEFEIKLMDFPFICRICLMRGDLRLFEEDDYLLDLFMTITKIDVRSTANFPRNVCNECISRLEDISLFIDFSKYNDSARQEKNLIPKKENIAIVNCGTSQEHVKTEDCEEEICRICSSTSCLTKFDDKAHLMQLFQNITNIDIEVETNFLKRNSICNKCINEVKKISLFISSSVCNDMRLKSSTGWNEDTKTKEEENAVDIRSPEYNDMKFESISGLNDIKLENNFNENKCSYESKDLHAVVDIKEEYLFSPEPSVRQNYQHELGFCSEINSVEKPLEYDPCKNEFSTEDHPEIIPKGLEVNMEAQCTTKKFKSDLCEKSLHRKTTHTGEKPIKCDICEKRFTNKSHLRRHSGIHTGERPFKCDICEKRFATRWHLQHHMGTHTGERPFKCDFCEKCFVYKHILKGHLRTHKIFSNRNTFNDQLPPRTGKKLIKCNSCDKSYSGKSIQKHIRSHSGEKPFKCDICEKSFHQKANLRRHLGTHTGEKPFRCDCCEKSLSSKDNLAKHLLTHTGERPFKCDICEKSFSQKATLQKHTRTHTGEKPFKCDICEKSFSKKVTLQNHTLAHPGETPFNNQYLLKESFY